MLSLNSMKRQYDLIPQFDGNRDDAPQTGRVIFQHRGVYVVGLAGDNFYNYVEALRILYHHTFILQICISQLSVFVALLN